MTMAPRFRVFVQQSALRLDAAALALHARRFFDAGLTELRREDDGEGQRFAVSCPSLAVADDVTCVARSAGEPDWAEAEAAEARSRAGGMGTLARRCRTTVEVTAGESPRAALLVAAIVAAVELGPIVSDDGAEIFGVKTARARLTPP